MSNRAERILSRQFITASDVSSAMLHDESSISIPENCTVTDEARELAQKHSIRFEGVGVQSRAPVAERPTQSIVRVTPPPPPSAAQPPALKTLPEGLNRRVVEAASEVFKDLRLGDRKAAALLPTVIRRVFAEFSTDRT
ncbi:MAG: hypothetical protein NTZ72_14090 [Afipia sp.]|nr:hypothetical protein [Afipia sp.]